MEDRRPKIIEDLGFNFKIDFEKLWKLEVPITEINIEELVWHFDIPFWEKDDTDDWNLTPWEVLNQTGESKEHQKKVEEANLEYPIDIMKNKDKWLVLDGLHRLAKAYKLGHKKIKVRIISPEKIREVTI